MLCLDRTLLSISLAVLAPSACSDDGLAPPAETDASTSGIATGGQGTGSSGPDTSNPGTGSATGGPSDGGSDGSATDTGGTGPAGTDTGTTGEPPSMTCEDARQCVLVDNCCECAAYHVDDEVPACDMECVQTVCSSLGIAGIDVVCEDGTCGLERRDCSGVVACDSPEPPCPEGTLPEVGPGGGGGCWTGACIPEEACDPVPSCDYCDETETCVVTETQLGSMVSCRAIPEDCAGVPTCECMPPDTCEPPFDTCVDMDGQITCTCPAC